MTVNKQLSGPITVDSDECYGIANYLDWMFNNKNQSKLIITGTLWKGIRLGTGGFSKEIGNSTENILMLWCHHQQGWGLLNHFPGFRYFPVFRYHQNTDHVLSTTVIFEICPQRWTVAASVKYVCDWKKMKRNFITCSVSVMWKLTNGSSVAPTPGWSSQQSRD